MPPGTETPPAAAAVTATGATAANVAQSATAPSTAVSQPPPPPALSVPEGVTVVFAERKRTGRIAGAKYKADGTPYKRPGPPPKPLHEKAAYRQRAPVKRTERSYTDQRRREVILYLESHKIACDKNDVRARRTWNGGREDQQPPAEKGYRWPTLREASEWFQVPERTIHSWWKRRDQIFGRVPGKLTKVEQKRLAGEEERKRREDGERRALLEAIGWPAERLPSGAPGGGEGQGEAMECVEGPSRPGAGRGGASEGVLAQRERQKEPLSVAWVSPSGAAPSAAGSAATSEGSIAGGTPATSIPAATPRDGAAEEHVATASMPASPGRDSRERLAIPSGQAPQGGRAISVVTGDAGCSRSESVSLGDIERGDRREGTPAAI
ncbi:purine-cytosine permease fcy22 [Colletotrichum tofieldiae]|uniref:Purine-cytosine permease fcy22 n=1 Tax=Colletotrichum tofieldiae TaxID=708197 RepID=A0A161Y762_9PEZI|nr:purine-cytosine permease fcy22 [Colletotrichum tofieldiae]GKT89765.1 purine-cytosine permease fcy22 [Colletotrichum tofieldiae]